jgi:hypothetical protein
MRSRWKWFGLPKVAPTWGFMCWAGDFALAAPVPVDPIATPRPSRHRRLAGRPDPTAEHQINSLVHQAATALAAHPKAAPLKPLPRVAPVRQAQRSRRSAPCSSAAITPNRSLPPAVPLRSPESQEKLAPSGSATPPPNRREWPSPASLTTVGTPRPGPVTDTTKPDPAGPDTPTLSAWDPRLDPCHLGLLALQHRLPAITTQRRTPRHPRDLT